MSITKLHASMTKITLALFTAASSLALSSCQDEDFGYTKEEISYATNFVAKYGKIDPNKSWDMTTAAQREERNRINQSQTRAAGDYMTLDSDGYYNVESGTLGYMERFLKERRNNLNIGSSFVFKAPSQGSFFIIPIYQGETGFKWSMWMNASGTESKIWEQSKGMQAKFNNGAWENLGWTDDASFSKTLDMPTDWPGYTTDAKMPEHTCYTIGASAVRSKPIEISGQNDKYIHFALKIDTQKTAYDFNKNGEWSNVDTYKSSLANMMLTLDGCPSPSNVRGDVLIIGCEDADNPNGTDNDLNDVVFLVVGNPNLPTVIKEKEITEKRYLIEDLGSTVDWDFNDVVVDVKQTDYYDILPTDSKTFNTTVTGYQKRTGETTQSAKLVHVCGTVPFQLQVGNTYFPLVSDPTDQSQTREQLRAAAASSGPTQLSEESGSLWNKSTEVTGWNPNEEKEISGWDPVTNNVHLYVWGNIKPGSHTNTADKFDKVIMDFAGRTISQVDFPLNGDIPYIIAVNPDVPWMKEGEDIPENWAKRYATADDSSNPTQGNFIPSTETDENRDESGSSLYYRYDNNNNLTEIVVWSGLKACVQYADALDLKSGGNLAALKEALQHSVDAQGHKPNTITVKTVGSSQFALRTDWDTNGQLGGADYAENLISTGTKTIVLSPDQYSAMLQKGLLIQSRSSKGDIFTEVTLSYTPTVYKLQVTPSEHTKVSANNDRGDFKIAYYAAGTSVELKARNTASTNDSDVLWYRFKNWEDNTTSLTRTVTMNGDVSVSITEETLYRVSVQRQLIKNGFAVPESRDGNTINYNGGAAGDVAISYTENGESKTATNVAHVLSGTSMTLTAKPNSGYEFVDWGWSPDVTNPKQVTLTPKKDDNGNYITNDYYALFRKSPVVEFFDYRNGAAATFTVSDATSLGNNKFAVKYNTTVDITATAKQGYTFVKWANETTDPSRTGVTITADKSYYAHFAKDLYDYSNGWGLYNGNRFPENNNAPDWFSELNTQITNGFRTLVFYFNGDVSSVNFEIYVWNGTKCSGTNNNGNYGPYKSGNIVWFTLTDDEANSIKNNGGFYIKQTSGSKTELSKIGIY